MSHAVRRRRARAAGAALLVLALAACSGAEREEGEESAPGDRTAVSTPSQDAAPQRYVALGDSFTAAPFVPASDTAQGCFRSSGNYPALLAEKWTGTEVVDASCSGADTTHMTRSQTTSIGGEVPAQFRALTEETDLVTVGIGGNDFDVYGTITATCPGLTAEDSRGAPCREAMRRGGKDVLESRINRIGARVEKVVAGIRERSPDARILVVNYPQMTPDTGRCDALPLARGDYAYTREIATRLDGVLRDATERSDAELVDLWRASKGHDICAEEPWVNGAVTDFSQALEYHPFAAGQRAAADLVLDALSQS